MSEQAYFDAVRLVAHLASELHSATLAAPSPSRRAHWEWMTAPPEPGDLVVELTTSWRRQGDDFDHLVRIGRFLGTRHEQIGDGDDARCETYRVIALADGRVFEWYNCSFARVPEEHLGILTGTTFWHGSFGGDVTLRSGERHPLPEFCRERLGVEMEPSEARSLGGMPMWQWPRDASGAPRKPATDLGGTSGRGERTGALRGGRGA